MFALDGTLWRVMDLSVKKTYRTLLNALKSLLQQQERTVLRWHRHRISSFPCTQGANNDDSNNDSVEEFLFRKSQPGDRLQLDNDSFESKSCYAWNTFQSLRVVL
jgi:hypothetical protein